MSVATLLDQTRARFPGIVSDEITVTALEKGGSDRKFYRIQTGLNRSLILVKYGQQREENRHYVEIAGFLLQNGIQVPEIYHHDGTEGLIWMEDLGETDIWASREMPWAQRRKGYEKTLEQAAKLHCLRPESAAGLLLQPEFDERLYRWEQEYFFENCLGRHFSASANIHNFPALAQIAETLATRPRVLVHRDFQSQNVMIRDDRAWLIDFQGLRPGLRQYDLASLLYDPYVRLSADERTELLNFYQSIANITEPDFLTTFDLCALQRLMQALGAYGFLGHEKGKPDFLRHIPQALNSLRAVAERIKGLEDLTVLLASLET